MNLYEMTQQQKHILAMEDVDQQTIDDTLEGLGIDEKFASYSVVIKTMNADSDALASAIKQLQDKKKSIDNKVKRLKDVALQSMQELDMKKAGNAIHSLTIRKGSKGVKLVVEDETYPCPPNFVKLAEINDMAGLKKAMKAGDTYEGFHLEDGEPSILIK
jgi:hypothetical protein